MPYFHATERHRLPSILMHGLGGMDPGPRSEACPRAVYLATDPRLALLMSIMHFANSENDWLTGQQALDDTVIIVVDDARLDAARLRPDPCVNGWTGSFAYEGVIDVRSAVTLSVDDALAAGQLPAVVPYGWPGF